MVLNRNRSLAAGEGPCVLELFLLVPFINGVVFLSGLSWRRYMKHTVSCYVTFNLETISLVYMFIKENSIIHCMLLIGN